MAADKPAPPARAPASLKAAPRPKVAAGPATAAKPGAAPDAAAYAREAVRLFAIGVDLHRRGRLADAVRAYGRSLLFNPHVPDVYNNLGVALRAQGKREAAVASYRRAVALNPEAANYRSNMGNALRELGRFEDAAVALQQALRLAPGSPEILYNFGLVLREMGRSDTALGCFNAVLKAKPDHAEAHFDRALTFLQMGDFKQGFAEFEWRWKLRRARPRTFKQPAWDGRDLAGATLFVHHEPGLGDTIQFARYAALARKKGGRVIVECPAELARLLETLDGVERVVIHGSPLPPFDVHAPLLSLPRLLGTTAETVPADVPYLRPPSLNPLGLPAADPKAIRVGVVWSSEARADGNRPGEDRHRTCPFPHVLELAGIPGVTLYSLQRGEAAGDLGRHAAEALMLDVGGLIADYADAAAAVARLDLIIGVDVPMVHLAGALGVPTWTLLSGIGDWRWGAAGETTPWYPSMRLLRQKTRGDWAGLLAFARDALARAVREGSLGRARRA